MSLSCDGFCTCFIAAFLIVAGYVLFQERVAAVVLGLVGLIGGSAKCNSKKFSSENQTAAKGLEKISPQETSVGARKPTDVEAGAFMSNTTVFFILSAAIIAACEFTHFVGESFIFGENGAAGEAAGEAAYTLLAMSLALMLVQGANRRHARNTKTKRAKIKIDQHAGEHPITFGDESWTDQQTFTSPKKVAEEPYMSTAQPCLAETGSKWKLHAARCEGEDRMSKNVSDGCRAVYESGGISDLQRNSVSSVTRGRVDRLQSSIKVCVSRRLFAEALAHYDSSAGTIGAGAGSLWSLLLYSAVGAKEFSRCEHFIERLCATSMPSGNDFVNIAQYYAHTRDKKGLTDTLEVFHRMGLRIDIVTRNRSLSAFASIQALHLAERIILSNICEHPLDIVGYNIMIKAFVSAGETARCFELYDEMQAAAIQASVITYGILLDACVASKQPGRARQVFGDLQRSGLKINVIHYTTYMKSLAVSGELEGAMAVLLEMQGTEDATPDLVAYSMLIKAYADHGRVKEFMRVFEQMLEQGIQPDGMVFNIVLTGCSVKPMDIKEIKSVFDLLLRNGLQPTTSTLSILIKVFAKSNYLKQALRVLVDSPGMFRLVPEYRLYIQLAQVHANTADGTGALDVYRAMVRASAMSGKIIDEHMSSQMFRICAACGGEYASVAGRIQHVVSQAAGLIDSHALTKMP